MVERLFLAVPRGCLRFVIVVFPDHTHLLFLCQYAMCITQTTTLKKEQALKHILKHVPHGQVKKLFLMTQINNKFESTNQANHMI